MKLTNLIKRHPIAVFFTLAYGITWGAILTLLGPAGLAPASSRPMATGLLVFMAMLAGPSVTGITLTALLEGRSGLASLVSRWSHWRVNPGWYALALLTTPLLLTTILALLARLNPVFVPSLFVGSDQATILGFGLVAGTLCGLFEEIGWTGFAIHRVLPKRGILATGLMVGFLWGAWHLLGDFWGNAGPYGSLYIPRGLLWVVTLTAYRVLMVWVYSKTFSLILAQIMHATFTGGQLIFGAATSPAEYLVWYGTFAAVLWVIVAIAVPRKQIAARRLQAQAGHPLS